MKKWFKYTIAFLTVLAIRLVPFRAPNLEPIMAFAMPMGKKYGAMMSFAFGSLSIAIYDAITSGWGIWTLITALSYGLVGLGSYFYFKNRLGWKSYASYAVIATIVYDIITGLTIGPLFFHQSFMVSLIGQIPFTLMHLLGNVSFAIILSPVIEKWMIKESASVSRIVVREAVRI
jgi:hypothetical protein